MSCRSCPWAPRPPLLPGPGGPSQLGDPGGVRALLLQSRLLVPRGDSPSLPRVFLTECAGPLFYLLFFRVPFICGLAYGFHVQSAAVVQWKWGPAGEEGWGWGARPDPPR